MRSLFMPQSTVQIHTNDQREFYYNALIKKVSEFKQFINEPQDTAVSKEVAHEIDRLLREAISFRDMFDIKTSVITLTRDDVNLLTRILNTSA